MSKRFNPQAQRVYDYICAVFGKYVISAQQEYSDMGSFEREVEFILKTTGKLPAMRGLDYKLGHIRRFHASDSMEQAAEGH